MTINTFLSYLNTAKKPLAVALFLVFGLVAARFWFTAAEVQGEIGVLGGPAGTVTDAVQSSVALAAAPMPGAGEDNQAQPVSEYDETLVASGILEAMPMVGTNPNQVPQTAASQKSNFDAAAYFVLPTVGFNYGKLHPHNAVDIANSCNTEVVAAADGLVTDFSLDSWSGGYGHYVIVSHPNGVSTRYSHLNAISVSLGDYVKQGQHLGSMGRTGDTSGCHLHFEIDGASNPFVK